MISVKNDEVPVVAFVIDSEDQPGVYVLEDELPLYTESEKQSNEISKDVLT